MAGRRFEAEGPAPIYKLTTTLWLHGHGGEEFEVWDDVSPAGRPGGLAMRGRARNWARLVKGKPTFGKDAPCETDFSSGVWDIVAQAAGRVTETDSPRPENARTAATHPSDGPDHPQEREHTSTGLIGARAGGGVMASAGRKNMQASLSQWFIPNHVDHLNDFRVSDFSMLVVDRFE